MAYAAASFVAKTEEEWIIVGEEYKIEMEQFSRHFKERVAVGYGQQVADELRLAARVLL